jgi:hypothetical protein
MHNDFQLLIDKNKDLLRKMTKSVVEEYFKSKGKGSHNSNV